MIYNISILSEYLNISILSKELKVDIPTLATLT